MNAAAPLDLAPLLNPRSVAVIGASAQGGRATGAVVNLQTLGFTGTIYPVNPKYEEVRGLKCYPNLEAIPGPVDLVCIGIPSEHVLSVLEEAHRKGVRAAVIFAGMSMTWSGTPRPMPPSMTRRSALPCVASPEMPMLTRTARS